MRLRKAYSENPPTLVMGSINTPAKAMVLPLLPGKGLSSQRGMSSKVGVILGV